MEGLCDKDKAVLRSILDPTATIGDVLDQGDKFADDEEPATEIDIQSKEFCAQGVQLAESGQLERALQLLTRGVEAAPERAAAYNDRAQLYRLMMRDAEALSDIERAVELTAGKRGRVRALALCQKGVLLLKSGRKDDARAAFQEAAKLGSSFARKQVVELNPYAALCNQMLSEIMNAEKDHKQ